MVSEPPEPLEPFDPARGDLAAMLSADVPGGWAAHALVQARVLWPMHVVSLRTLEPQDAQWMAALRAAGIHELPRPGCFTGGDLRAVWSRPTECLALTQDATAASVLLGAAYASRALLTARAPRSRTKAGAVLFGVARAAALRATPRVGATAASVG